MYRKVFILCMFAASTAALPVQASHFGYPLLDSTVLDSGAWVSYDLTATEGATLEIYQWIVASDVLTASLADWVSIAGEPAMAGLQRVRGKEGTRVVTSATGVLVEDERERTSDPGWFRWWSKIWNIPAGKVNVVVGAVSSGGSMDGHYSISGVGITLTGQRSGTGSFVVDAEGFDPETHVRGPGGDVEVAAKGVATVTTDVPLYAWFTAEDDFSSTRYEGPTRTETALATHVGVGIVGVGIGDPWIVLWGEPAGEHRFVVEAAIGAGPPVACCSTVGWELVGVPAAAI